MSDGAEQFSPARRWSATARWLWPLVAAAALFTLLNAFKPLVIDDTAYYFFARQVSEAPGDPYGFEIFWGDRPAPAMSVLAPSLLPYWLGLGIAVVGDNPFLWKLWLFPFALILTLSVSYLGRMAAPGQERWILCLVLFSPALLPAFNLMLDVPALALAVGAVSLFWKSIEGNRPGLMLAAGFAAGLAMQTKYTGVVAPILILILAILHRRWLWGILAGLLASMLFLSWEFFLLYRYGASHFLTALSGHPALNAREPPILWGLWLLTLVGGVGFPIATYLLSGSRRSSWLATASVALTVCAFWTASRVSLPPGPVPDVGEAPAAFLIYALLGGVLVATFGISLRTRFTGHTLGEWSGEDRRYDLFLASWLVVEIVLFFVLSPFPAARRVVGLCLVLTLIAARVLAGAQGAASKPQRVARMGVCWGVFCGLMFYAVDLSDARAQRRSVENVQKWIQAQPESGTVWFVGHWGFQFYAQGWGMKPVIPGSSSLAEGDWLVVPEGIARQAVQLDAQRLSQVALIEERSRLPWSSLPAFYAGPFPLAKQNSPHIRVRVFQVRTGHIPARLRQIGS